MNVFLIAVRNLFGEKGRLFITAGGVAFSVALILVLVGLYQGWSAQMTRFLGSIDTDFWVGQKGSRDASHSISILPLSTKGDLANQALVSEVSQFTGRQAAFKKGDKETHLFLVALDSEKLIKPYGIVEGKAYPADNEIIIDKTAAKESNIKVGDKISLNNTDMTVSGISSGGNIMIYSYAFANQKTTEKVLQFQGFTNYFLVKTSNPSNFQKNLSKEMPNLEIIKKDDFLNNNSDTVRETFLPIIGVLTLIAIMVGVAVIGLTIYTATLEKSREFGVLKAIGYTNGQLFLIGLIQSFISGIIGFLFGVVLAFAIAYLAMQSVPSFIFEISWIEITLVFASTFVMCLIAIFIPLKRLFSIDPANIFKA